MMKSLGELLRDARTAERCTIEPLARRSFDAAEAHFVRNDGDQTASIQVVVTPPSF